MSAADNSAWKFPPSPGPLRPADDQDRPEVHAPPFTHPWTRDDEQSAAGEQLTAKDDEPTGAGGAPAEDPGEGVPVRHIPDWDWAPRSRHDPQPSLAETPRRDVAWLWPGRIPLGRVTLLVGDPGVGKSLLALDVAARTTAALPWPDAEQSAESKERRAGSDEPKFDRPEPATSTPGNSCTAPSSPPSASNSPPSAQSSTLSTLSSTLPSPPSSFDIRHSEIRHSHSPASVLILSAEDDLADTIRPRLEAAGADLARVVALPATWSPEDPAGLFDHPNPFRSRRPLAERPRPLDLRRDVPELDRLLASRPDCRLVIIDPLAAYLGPGIENSNAEVRRVLAPLAELAARRRLAVLAVCHLRKAAGAAVHRTMGSLAFVAAARSAWLVARDPHDSDRRLLLPVKNNLAATATGSALSFTIESASHPLPRERAG